MHGIGVLLFQPLSDAQRVIDRCFQRGDMFVVVDADNEGVAPFKGKLNVLAGFGHGRGLLFDLLYWSVPEGSNIHLRPVFPVLTDILIPALQPL